MTDEELWAEVRALQQEGFTGEDWSLEGTPEGDALWCLIHPEPVPEMGRVNAD